MKATRLLLTALAFAFAIAAQAQGPGGVYNFSGIPFQAAARNANGNILANAAISVRFTIHDSTTNGVAVYQETHTTTTTAQGMFSLNMGMGTAVNGTFAGINWGSNAKFMQVELSTNGGSSYTDMGTTQMMSVPYALYAKEAASLKYQHKEGYDYTNLWTCPNSVSSIIVELWGASGGGSCYNSGLQYSQVGGRGGYNSAAINVIPGQQYLITIGVGGATSTSIYINGGTGAAGGNSSFSTLLIAEGGSAGALNLSGGIASSGTVNNWTYPNNNSIPSYIPTHWLSFPSVASGGYYYNGTNGQSGYCLISY